MTCSGSLRVTEFLFDRFGAQTQKRKRVTNNWTKGKKSRSTIWRREHADKVEAKRLQQVAASYEPTLHALQAVLVSPAAVIKEANRLKYPTPKLHTMLLAVRFAVRRILDGNSKYYSYEQAAESMEESFDSVRRWLRLFRADRYTLHRTGQQVACKTNSFPPSQQVGHLPEVLCTPEVREECRQFVYANAVKKGARNMRVKEFQDFVNTVILDPKKVASPMQEAAIRRSVLKMSGQAKDTSFFHSRSFWCGVWTSRCKAVKKEKVCWEAARMMLEDQLGFSYTDVRKGVYVDRFDEPDNVAFRNDTYLPLCAEIDRRAYRCVPLWWRADHTLCTVKELQIHPAHIQWFDASGATGLGRYS